MQKIHSINDIRDVISNASSFSDNHCKAEENLMLEMDYPYECYKKHYAAHSSLRLKMKKFKDMEITENDVKDTLVSFVKLVLEWFVDHSARQDIKLAVFIKDEIHYTQKLKLKVKEFFKLSIF